MTQYLNQGSRVAVLILAVLFGISGALFARDLKISIPKRSNPTPVQKLNREGVKAVQKNQIDKAEKLFYKAYLIDPDDPFTLNNLGYISEIQGKVDRAQQYYSLAEKENSEAVVSDSSLPNIKGHSLAEVTSGYSTLDLAINRGNVQSMSLLQQGRTSEAEGILRRTLARDPKNPFTINNLGYVMEAEGDFESALIYYNQAASLNSSETIVVALDPRWRGKGISEVATANANAIRTRLATEDTAQARARRLNLQGVYALNHNEPVKARGYFEQAYKLDPENAFTLNNRGYLAEMDGDQELANDFYTAAKQAQEANEKVAVTNHVEMKGMRLGDIADTNDQTTEATLEARQEEKRRRGSTIELRRRDGTAAETPAPEEGAQTPHALVPRPPVDNAPVDNGPVAPPIPRPQQQ